MSAIGPTFPQTHSPKPENNSQEVETFTKTTSEARHVFDLVSQLDHPLFVKVYTYDESQKSLTMERVNGKPLVQYVHIPGKYGDKPVYQDLSTEFYLECLERVKNAALYLFNNNCFWTDTNEINVMVNNEKHIIKVIDYDFWGKEENTKDRMDYILGGALHIIQALTRARLDTDNHNLSHEELHIVEDEVWNQKSCRKVPSSYAMYLTKSKNCSPGCYIKNIPENPSNDEAHKFIQQYFETVIKNARGYFLDEKDSKQDS